MEKLLAGMEFYIHLFEDPHLRKSCWPERRSRRALRPTPSCVTRPTSASRTRKNASKLGWTKPAACKSRLLRLDTDSLAKLWIATIQEDPSRSF